MTKEELKQYLIIKAEAEQVREQIVRLQSFLTSDFAGVQRNILPRGQDKSDDKIGKTFDKINALQDRYFSVLSRLCEKQLEIEDAVASLPPQYQTLLRYKYLIGCTWEQIALKMNYSYDYVKKEMQNKALEMLNDK